MWRLFYPLKYFSLENREKRTLDLWPTLLLCALISTPYLLFWNAPFFGPSGFLDKVLGLVSALTGFYVAALVAAATFSHPDLDKVITVGEIKLAGDPITRRQFACIIFGYLAFASLIVSILCAMSVTLSGQVGDALKTLPAVHGIRFQDYHRWLRSTGVIGMDLAVAHIMVVTALGLYYLMDRLHVREPVVLAKKSDIDKAA